MRLSRVFWWLNLVSLCSLYEILYPKRRIESYSIIGTIVSPNKILLKWAYVDGVGFGGVKMSG